VQRSDDRTCHDEQAEAGGQHRDQGEDDDQDDRGDQDRPLVQPDRQRGQDRAADGQAQRVGGNQSAGRRDGHLEVGGDQVQQADDEQLAAAQHEHPQEQRGQSEVRLAATQRGRPSTCLHHPCSISRNPSHRSSSLSRPAWTRHRVAANGSQREL
jgi:hypothetical protein